MNNGADNVQGGHPGTDVAECKVCGEPALNPKAWFKFGRFRVPLYEVCGMSAINLVRLVVRLRDELLRHGILVGIPKQE